MEIGENLICYHLHWHPPDCEINMIHSGQNWKCKTQTTNTEYLKR